ncbi:MAG: SCO family protein [Ignavibacteriales bacterium]|nr:SCO family protein [Ignavibacteriales bacterium]
MIARKLFTIVLLFSTLVFCGEQAKKSIVGIDEQLGQNIPVGLQFTDEHGKKVELSSLVDKPTIFMFVYFECPGICTPLMSSVASEIGKIGMKPGQDYRIISVSFDHTEGYELAAKKKANYLNAAEIEVPENGWRFLTGDSNAIATLTDADYCFT